MFKALLHGWFDSPHTRISFLIILRNEPQRDAGSKIYSHLFCMSRRAGVFVCLRRDEASETFS